MKHTIRIALVLAVLLINAALANAQQTAPPKPSQKSEHHHDQHDAGVNRRGDQAMGFSHTKTTHHFLLKTDGGVIQVEAKQAEDTTSRDQIRQHLRHIAKKFAAGDFTAPMFIHAQTPPGVPVMRRLKAAIKYEYEETERGARVRISTREAEAIRAIHEFLRFQIKDHQTGDSGEIEKNQSFLHPFFDCSFARLFNPFHVGATSCRVTSTALARNPAALVGGF